MIRKVRLCRRSQLPHAANCRGGATFTMVIFLLLLISTGFMYYFFQKSRALERELTAWRSGSKEAVEVDNTGSDDQTRSVGGYVTAMRDKIMGNPDSPKPAVARASGDEAQAPGSPVESESSRQAVPNAPPEFPDSAAPSPDPARLLPQSIPESTPRPSPSPAASPAPFEPSVRELAVETLPAPSADPFEEELPPPTSTPRALSMPRPADRESEASGGIREEPRPSTRQRVQATAERAPTPRATPRKTPARAASNEKIGSMYDLKR